jgi:hypothetical protein
VYGRRRRRPPAPRHGLLRCPTLRRGPRARAGGVPTRAPSEGRRPRARTHGGDRLRLGPIDLGVGAMRDAWLRTFESWLA